MSMINGTPNVHQVRATNTGLTLPGFPEHLQTRVSSIPGHTLQQAKLATEFVICYTPENEDGTRKWPYPKEKTHIPKLVVRLH